MSPSFSGTEIRRLAQALLSHSGDISAAYITLRQINELVTSEPRVQRPEAIAALGCFLQEGRYQKQRRAEILYREAADSLVAMAVTPCSNGLRPLALDTLAALLNRAPRRVRQPVAEAADGLPTVPDGPRLPLPRLEKVPVIPWRALNAHPVLTPFPKPRSTGPPRRRRPIRMVAGRTPRPLARILPLPQFRRKRPAGFGTFFAA